MGKSHERLDMDWKKIVSDLLESGLTQEELGKKVQCSQTLISGLLTKARGKQLSFEIGIKLVNLHNELTGKK